MKLKRHINFINESFVIKEKEKEINKIIKMIKSEFKKHHIDSSFHSVHDKHTIDMNYYVSPGPRIYDNVFLIFYFKQESDPKLGYIQEYLPFIIPTAKAHYVDTEEQAKEREFPRYLISFNYDETINNQVVRSNMGISKYKL